MNIRFFITDNYAFVLLLSLLRVDIIVREFPKNWENWF